MRTFKTLTLVAIAILGFFLGDALSTNRKN